MSTQFVLPVEYREEQGKGASRRLRRSGRVPAIVYGGHKPARSISIDLNEIKKLLAQEAFYASVITLDVGKVKQPCVLKDVQRDPARGYPTHLDFQRVVADEKIRVSVPLHFRGEAECPGVKRSHGVVSHVMTEIEISCLPKDLPEYLELDVSAMDVEEAKHLSDVPVPPGVEIIALTHGDDHDQPVFQIHRPRTEEELEALEEEVVPEAPEPEVVGEEEASADEDSAEGSSGEGDEEGKDKA